MSRHDHDKLLNKLRSASIIEIINMAKNAPNEIYKRTCWQHFNWKKAHKKELENVKLTGKCKCGAEITAYNNLFNRGYEYGIECSSCK
jgi:hypothetical protein